MTRSMRWRLAQSMRWRLAQRLPSRWWLNLKLWLILIAFLLLSGCVRYEVGVTFVDANHGTIVQRVRLDDQITGVSQATAMIWLDHLAAQTQQLGGQVKHPSQQELIMTIPFYNAKDLGRKFDPFFQAMTDARLPDRRLDQLPAQLPEQPQAQSRLAPISRLQIQTRNFLLWQHHQLTYDLDLSSLSIIPTVTPTKAFVIDPQELLHLEFALNTPWGAEANLPTNDLNPQQSPNSLIQDNVLLPTVHRQGKQLIWSLKPGKINHLEASFSLPSPLGIGAVVIVVAVGAGMFLRAWNHPSSLIDYPKQDY